MERNNPVLSVAEGNELVATHSLRSVQAWAKSELPPGRPCGRRRRSSKSWTRA